MKPDAWQKVVALFEQAAKLPEDGRAAFLKEAAPHDPDMVEMVERMLANDAGTGWLLDLPLGRLIPFLADSPPDLPIGSTVAGFEIRGELGRGGMGVVYEAWDPRLERLAALKFLTVSDGLRAKERLIAEARAASALDHPNIASVFQIGESADGRLFIAFARYEGETLAQRLARDGCLSAGETRDIATQLARGLAAAHAADLVHRDVKPANVFLTTTGVVKLLDFGIASAVGDDASAAGTISYMSPEQARGEPLDPRSDVWSWGLVCVEMLSGLPPWSGVERPDLLDALTGRGPWIPPSKPAGDLRPVLSRTLEEDPDMRHRDAQDLLSELERLPGTGEGRSLARRFVPVAMIVGFAGLLLWSSATGPGSEWSLLPDALDATVAVFPFENLGDEDESDYFAAGVTDRIVAALASAEGMAILGPSATGAISGRSIGEVGMRLGASYVLAGGVQRSGGTVRVTATLSRSLSGEVVWADDYQRDLTVDNLFAIQGDVAETVAERLEALIAPSAAERLRAPPTPTLEAYDHLLRGDFELVRRTPVSVMRAIGEYREASRLDPDFVPALARESYGYLLYVDWGWDYPGLDRKELLARGAALSDSALAKDTTSPDAWLASAYALVQEDPAHMTGAVTAFQRAIALNPSDAETYHQYGQSLMALGRWPEAISAYHAALALEPTRAMTLVPLSAIHLRTGDLAEATRWADSAVAVGGDVPYAWSSRAGARLLLGDFAGGAGDAETALRIDPSYSVPARSNLAVAQYGLGDTIAAGIELARAIAAQVNPSAPSPTSALYLGGALVALNRAEEALDFLERTRPRAAWLWWYLQHPIFDAVRAHPRFQTLEHEVDPR
jgi:serine/threonine protein kinase/tetratricopeptide (TPR) repeat protein